MKDVQATVASAKRVIQALESLPTLSTDQREEYQRIVTQIEQSLAMQDVPPHVGKVLSKLRDRLSLAFRQATSKG